MPKPFIPQDRFFKKAKEQNLRARSVFKLEEIQKKYRVIKQGNVVLDLGAAPGSWTQFASGMIGEGGKVVALDLQEIEKFGGLKNVETKVIDVFSEECMRFLSERYGKFDVILSDMAPKTSGIKDNDQWASVELGLRVLELCEAFLKTGGTLVLKIFQGGDFNLFWKKCKLLFIKATIVRPEAVRSSSREVYIVAERFKG